MMSLDDAILHCKDRAREDCSECAKEHQQLAEWLKELKGYKDLGEQGKLLILPAAIGDKVFSIYMDCPKDYKEEYCKDHDGGCENCHHRKPVIMRKIFQTSDIRFINSIYVTREEAKAALKALES